MTYPENPENKDQPETSSSSAWFNKIGNLRVSEGLLIAAIPVTAYAVAYFYDLGYLTSFGIPMVYVQIDTSRIVYSLFAAVPVFYMVFQFLTYSDQIIRDAKKDSSFPNITFSILLIPMILSLYISLFLRSLLFAKIAGGFFLVIVFFGGGYLLFLRFQRWRFDRALKRTLANPEAFYSELESRTSQRITKTKDTASTIDEKGSKATKNNWLRNIRDWPGQKISLIYLSLLGMIIILFLAGYVKASSETLFPVIKIENRDCAVVYAHSEQEICVAFDRATKKLSNEFVIINLTAETEFLHTVEIIGPLGK